MKTTGLAIFFLFAFSFLFLAGCYGLQNPAQCDSMDQPVDQMRCYRKAAINAAYANDENNVHILCDKIADLGLEYGRMNLHDIEKTAETEKNRCYYDAAIIMGATKTQEALRMCDKIESSNIFGLKGAAATQEGCREEVGRLAALNPENYYNNPSNICALVGILLLPLAALLFNRCVHKL